MFLFFYYKLLKVLKRNKHTHKTLENLIITKNYLNKKMLITLLIKPPKDQQTNKQTINCNI